MLGGTYELTEKAIPSCRVPRFPPPGVCLGHRLASPEPGAHSGQALIWMHKSWRHQKVAGMTRAAPVAAIRDRPETEDNACGLSF